MKLISENNICSLFYIVSPSPLRVGLCICSFPEIVFALVHIKLFIAVNYNFVWSNAKFLRNAFPFLFNWMRICSDFVHLRSIIDEYIFAIALFHYFCFCQCEVYYFFSLISLHWYFANFNVNFLHNGNQQFSFFHIIHVTLSN